MSQVSLDELLESWVYWLFPQPWGNNNAAVDPSGNATRQLNAGSAIWFLSGTWGGNAANRPIRVEQGSRLFIVVASSHAVPGELQQLPNPVPNPTDAQLIQHARNVAGLWTRRNLTIDGAQQQLPPSIQTRILFPYVGPGGYYDTQKGVRGPTRMATIADVFLFNGLGNQGDRHNIVIDAESRADPNLGEVGYTVDVTYNITVI